MVKSKQVIITNENAIPDDFVTFVVKSRLKVEQFKKVQEVLGKDIEGVANVSLKDVGNALKENPDLEFAEFKINKNIKIS